MLPFGKAVKITRLFSREGAYCVTELFVPETDFVLEYDRHKSTRYGENYAVTIRDPGHILEFVPFGKPGDLHGVAVGD